MDNPFRSQLWQQTIRKENRLTHHEFCMSMTDSNGIFVRLSDINEMITDGILTVDFDKLEDIKWIRNLSMEIEFITKI